MQDSREINALNGGGAVDGYGMGTPFMTLSLCDEPGCRDVRIQCGRRSFVLELRGGRHCWREDGGYHLAEVDVETAVGESWVQAARTLLHAAAGLSERLGEYRRIAREECSAAREVAEETFDDVWFLQVDAGSVDEVERAFIRRFQPEYNRTHNRAALRAAGGAR